MTDGTSQGLFVVLAIVIFGVFVALSYTVFGSEGLTGDITELVSESISQTSDRTRRKTLVYSNNDAVNTYNDSWSSSTHDTEFIWYGIDLTPIFDEHGVGQYLFEFEAKSNKDGRVTLYTQNGTSAKYTFGHSTFYPSREYEKFSFEVTTRLTNDNVDRSMLAFYSQYGSGVFPTIRNMRIYKLVE